MLSMMEIYPENAELTRIFSKWFKSVWCFGKWTDEELALNCEETYDVGNIYYGSLPDKFNEGTEFFIFIHNINERKLFDWKDKLFSGGYIAGDRSVNIKPKKKINRYWIGVNQ